MYPVVGALSFHHHHQFNDFESMSLRFSKMPSFYQQDPVYYPPQPNFYHFQPVQQFFSKTTVIIINNRPNNFYLPTTMQLSTASNHSPSSQMSSVPARYNSYFSPSSHYRPIQIDASSSAAAADGRYTSYNGMDRVMALDFDQPSTNNTNNNNNNTSSSSIDSVYLMDFMDDENPPASSSVTPYSKRTDLIEGIFQRVFLSPSTEENKENNTSTTTAASGASASVAAAAPRLPPSPSPPKPGFSLSNVPRPLSSPTLPAHQQILSNIKICGPPGSRSFKRLSSYDDEALMYEESESETGLKRRRNL